MSEARTSSAGVCSDSICDDLGSVEPIGGLQSKADVILKVQDARRLTHYEIEQLESNAKKNWDVVYKKQGTRFFKNRRWLVQRFKELILSSSNSAIDANGDKFKPVLLELGCGGGNLFYPILAEVPDLEVWACDFSPRALEFVKNDPAYDPEKICPFAVDLTLDKCFDFFQSERRLSLRSTTADFVAAIFVLSYISPDKHSSVIENVVEITRPGSIVFFRDYGLHDSAQLRFKPGKKISENFYVRQDGTRSYYFSVESVIALFTATGHFKQIECEYLNRRTVNVKEKLDAARVYVQGKFIRI